MSAYDRTTRTEQIAAVMEELQKAERHGKEFASLHEGYAVILEELDEIWDVTRQKRRDRSEEDLRKEFIQLAAMCFKALGSVHNFIGGKV